MASTVVLVATKTADKSSNVTSDGTTRVTVGIRAMEDGDTPAEIAIGEYIGCPVMQVDSGGGFIGRARDKCGRPVVLTTARPWAVLEDAGDYVVVKGATVNAVEVWADEGA